MRQYREYTTGQGYHIPTLEQPQPQQQAPAAQAAPRQAAAPAQWKFGDMGDIQNTEGGDQNLSFELRRKATELEGWMNTMIHHNRIDPTTVDYRNPVSEAAHRHYLNTVSELRDLQGRLLQGRENQKMRNAQIASGRIMPGAQGIDGSQPLDQAQFEQGFGMPTSNPHVERHNKFTAGVAKTQPELAQHQQSYADAVNGIQADARRLPQQIQQGYVQHQISLLNKPAQGIERDQATNQSTTQSTHWNSSEHLPSARGAGGGGSGGENIGALDIHKMAQLARGQANPDLSPGTPDYVGGAGQIDRFGAGLKIGRDEILGVKVSGDGRTGWVVRPPATKEGRHMTQPPPRFVEWQHSGFGNDYDIVGEILKLNHVPAGERKLLVQSLQHNGYVHMDANGNPTNRANIDAILNGEQGQAPQQPPAASQPQEPASPPAIRPKYAFPSLNNAAQR